LNLLNEVLTVKEAAKLSKVSQRYIQQLCKSGKIVARYADGVWLILKSSIIKKENDL
jgi:hypothetical protein